MNRQAPMARATMNVEIGFFTKIPNKFFGSGMAHQLGVSASVIYLALCEHANRNGSNTFKVSDRAIESDTGSSSRTISNARKRLIEYKLIDCNRDKGESFEYTILAQEFQWVPEKHRRRVKREPRAYHAKKP
jgi:hypothetical protein